MEKILNQWLFFVRHMYGHKPKTVKIYTRIGNMFIQEWGQASSISTEDVEAFIMKDLNKGLTNATINQKLAVLKVFLTWAESHNKIKERPKVNLLRVPRVKVVKSFSSEEINKLLDAVQDSPIELAVWICLMTGLRREEIRFLEWRDIDLEKKTIYIKAKEGFSPKSYSERAIPISDSLAQKLKRRKKCKWVVSHGWNQVSNCFLERYINDSLKKAGLYESGMPTWHRLRHTFASKFIEAGGDIQSLKDLMGHANINTTQTYMHSNPSRQRSIIEDMGII